MKKHKPIFASVAIVGVGLIGGSLALAIKRRYPGIQVVGIDKPSVLSRARARHAIDRAERDLSKGVRGADLVVLAAPLNAILDLLPKVAANVSDSTIVTDVGSVKLPVVRAARKYFQGNFIGGHPMAGVELSGIEAAHPLLFENAIYVLTPSQGTTRSSLESLGSFLAGLGSRTLVMDARTHDQVASAVSHLPQLTAVALMRAVGCHTPSRHYLQLAAGGFRDLTRIASSKIELWNPILSLNRKEIGTSLDRLVKELQTIRRSVLQGNRKDLKSRFREARRLRGSIPRDMKGFLHSLAAVHVFVPDRPGMLARLTGIVSREKLNIKDLELMKIREGSGGTFRLSFETREIAEKARKILRRKGFEIAE